MATTKVAVVSFDPAKKHAHGYSITYSLNKKCERHEVEFTKIKKES